MGRMTTAHAVEPQEELTTAQLLLRWDQTRARSQQREFGMSELGECRRRAGYRLAGTEPTNPSGSVQAVMGTAVHAAVENVYRHLQAAGLIPADDLVEHEVRFAGILGHLDRYIAGSGTLVDTKTTTSRWLSKIRVYGPPKSNLWQVNAYAAALIAEKHPVRRIVIDYLARDTGDEHRWSGTFDPLAVKDALEWVRLVRDTPLQWLPRDYEPDSQFCAHCPFYDRCWDGAVPNRDPRSVLFVERPDARRWAEQLEQARADEAAAKARAAEAKGALDALRPDHADDEPVLMDVGYERLLRWRRVTSSRLDSDAVKAEYAKVGAKPPMKESTATYLEFVAPEDVEPAVAS